MTTIAQSSARGDAHAARTSWLAQRTERTTVIGVNVTFQYDDNFDRARVITIAENARGKFEGMPGLRFKFFTLDDEHRRATNFYVWDSKDTADGFFSDEMRERVTGLYGVPPTIDFVKVAQIVENSLEVEVPGGAS